MLGGPGRGEESQGSPTLLQGPPTVLLVLLNQEPQGVRLSQGHISIHAEVVGASLVLAAQVSVRGKGVKARGRERSSRHLRLVPELPQKIPHLSL